MTTTTSTNGQHAHDRAEEASVCHPHNWAPRLSRIIVRQRDLYKQLDHLSLQQGECIAQDRTQDLLGILGHRQRIIEELGRLNEEMVPFVAQWNELSGSLPEQDRTLLRESFDEVSRLVMAIGQRDEADRRALESRKAQLGSEIGGIVNARGAVSAYAGHGLTSGPRFQDREG